MQNHQSSEIGSGGVVYCFHDRFLLLESVIVSILKGVYCLFFSRSTMSGNFPSDEVGKSYTYPVGKVSATIVRAVVMCHHSARRVGTRRKQWNVASFLAPSRAHLSVSRWRALPLNAREHSIQQHLAHV